VLSTKPRLRRRSAWAVPTPSNRPVRVLYIGGLGRSGTTLLDRMLGQLPGFFSAGELVHLWARGLRGERCGCGATFLHCEFWGEVGRRAFGNWQNVDVDRLLQLQRRVDRSRAIPGMLMPAWPPYRQALTEYVSILARLYAAISDVTGGAIIIDSSKHPSYAFLLRRVPVVSLRVVQMVRGSHGVAYSWTKVVERPEVVDRLEHMPRYSPLHSATWWTAYNSLLQALPAVGTPSLVVQYEHLVNRPREELERILELAEQADGRAAVNGFVSGHRVHLERSHMVAGNPMRFRQGEIQLRLDDEWQLRMPPLHRLLVTMVSWPMLHRFGYAASGTSNLCRGR